MILNEKQRKLLNKWKEDSSFWNNLSINQRDIINTVLREEVYHDPYDKRLNDIRDRWVYHIHPDDGTFVSPAKLATNGFSYFKDDSTVQFYEGGYHIGTDTGYVSGDQTSVVIYSKRDNKILDID